MTSIPTTRTSLLFRLRDSQDHEAWVEFVEIYEPAIYRQFRKSGLQDAECARTDAGVVCRSQSANREVGTGEGAGIVSWVVAESRSKSGDQLDEERTTADGRLGWPRFTVDIR